MVEYDIKKGWYKNIEGDLLEQLMKESFGNVAKNGDTLTSSYGVLARIDARITAKDRMEISTVSRQDAEMKDEDILDSKRRLNAFAEKATGFDSKARMKRAQEKAKKGGL
ncbi:MAG: DUF5611 family protein [Candidatus Methanoplasma sp.]|jgi:hypothetical protein|nr:DUF5611 family protein [Candidatus Methanoplasma sp.]